MTYVHLKNVNVSIPIYDSHALRLIRLPAFRDAQGRDRHRQPFPRRHRHSRPEKSEHGGRRGRPRLPDRPQRRGQDDAVAGRGRHLPVDDGLGRRQGQHVRAARGQHRAEQRRHRLREHQADRESLQLAERRSIRTWSAKSRSSPSSAYTCRCRPASIRPACRRGSHSRSPPRRFPTFCWSTRGSARAMRNSRKRRRRACKQFVSRARILLLASHSADLCRAMCSKALVLSKGEAVFFGEVEEGFKVYASLS